MFIDKQLMVSKIQEPVANGDNLSTYSIDLSVARNIAKGEPLYLIVVIDESFAGTGTTMIIKVVTDSDQGLATNNVVLVQTPAISKTILTAGRAPIVIALPPLPASGGAQKYLGVVYTNNNTFEDSGILTAFFGVGPQTNV